MWRIYAAVWLAYLVTVSIAFELDNIARGDFDFSAVAQAIVLMLPQALILALTWPLTGYLERTGRSLPAVVRIHAGGAILFALGMHAALLTMTSKKGLSWYVWPFLYSMLMYGVAACIFHLVRASRTAQRQAQAMQQAQNLLIASELSALRSKLNPHFLFNTLHSIIALTRKDSSAAEAALFHFSDMLRYLLDTEKSGHDRVTLDEEMRFVRDYLDLEALRLGARLTVEWDIDDDAAGQPLLALTLQPLVENSIKHAFNPHSRPGKLLIRTRLDAGARRLHMTVRDDGPGADAAQVRASTGLGIRTVERRLALEYGARASFDISTMPGAGFDVSLSIPLEAA